MDALYCPTVRLVLVAGLLVAPAAGDRSPSVHDIVVSSNDALETFALVPTASPADVSGEWTMSVVPSAGCREGLPSAAPGRPYEVQFIQTGTRLRVKISGPTLSVANPDAISGTVVGTQVRFTLPGNESDVSEWTASDINDHPSATETFGFNGSVDGALVGSEIRASMWGSLTYWDSPTFEPTWYCVAKDHVVTLRRR